MAQVAFKVIRPGQMTTLQDGGRHGYRSYGIPTSGFMDALSAQQANFIVGNPTRETLIEMIQVGATLEFLTSATIALTGAGMEAQLNGQSVRRFEAIEVNQGDLLELGKTTKHMIGYLAIAGQWDIPKVLGSTSTFLRAKIGGIDGRQLQKGDIIRLECKATAKTQSLPEHQIRAFAPGRKIRLMETAESNPELSNWLESTAFTVTRQWDRMGIRLEGNAPSIQARHILSSPITVGTMQLPPDGQPIIVMADGQTTGGYPRIATVIKADLPYLAQQQPGTPLHFTFVSTAQAKQTNIWTLQTIS